VPERILERIFANETLSEEEWVGIGETIDAASTQLHALTTLVSHPGYRMGILPLPKDAANLPDYTALQRLGLFLLLKARFTEHATNDLREAVPYALTALQITVRKNSSPTINHLIAIALQLRLTKTLAHFAANCQDRDLLKEALAEMIRLMGKKEPETRPHSHPTCCRRTRSIPSRTEPAAGVHPTACSSVSVRTRFPRTTASVTLPRTERSAAGISRFLKSA
jgi:hypothetical protein